MKGWQNIMRVFIDTNIVIDYLSDHTQFADQAEKLFILCERGVITGVLTASSITDIYYIMRKIIGREDTLKGLRLLFSILEITEVGKNDLLKAMESNMADFEDALVTVCAKRTKTEYIITRNVKDYMNSSVLPLTPEQFLTKFFSVVK